ncbi:pyrimidodiazepine synthase-like isoform X2 [Condylostylus longicornis]|nr:pyrimidodiazepine synthase-like isoform X2 [Condylostylus longicornis]
MNGGKHYAKGSTLPALPDDGVLRLYSMRFCPFAHRAHLILEAKNVPYHTVFINLTEKPEWLTTKSPLGKVPALELTNIPGAEPLIESLIICEYLDEKYPENPLYPKDPLQKAYDKILIERFSPIAGAMRKVFVEGVPPGSLSEICSGLDIYEAELKKRGTKYFGGEKPGMLDYMIWPWCERSDMLQYLIGDKYRWDENRFAKLLEWRDLMKNNEAVKRSYLDGETHAKYMKSYRTGTPDYDMLV